MRRRTAIAVVGLGVIGAACASRPAMHAVDPGCYYFERDAAAERLRLPWGVRLLDDSLTGWPALAQLPDVRRAVTLVDLERTASEPFGYWRVTGHDSVEIGYPAGGGLVLDLTTQEGRLTGTALAVGDALAPPAATPAPTHTPVSLLHARCPDPG